MLSCPQCGNTIYPKICPAIIVGVIDGGIILIMR
jgi:NAD+ diphosphatase